MPEKVKKNLLGRTVIKKGLYRSGGREQTRQSYKAGKNRDFDKEKKVVQKDDGSKVVTKSREVYRKLGDNNPETFRKKRVVTKTTDASGKKTREVRKFKTVSNSSADATTKTVKNASGTNRSVTTRTQNGRNISTQTNMGPLSQALTYRHQIKKIK